MNLYRIGFLVFVTLYVSFLVLMGWSRVEYSFDARLPAFFISCLGFFCAYKVCSAFFVNRVLYFFLGVFVYVFVWWGGVFLMMFLCGVLDSYDFFGIYLSNAISGSRSFFRGGLIVFLSVFIAISGLKIRKIEQAG